ncbi:hypothetical protein ACWGRF_02030 [Streptomyces zhihengii]
MANTQPTRAQTPPEVGRNLSVRILDEGMRDDLAVLLRVHDDMASAVRHALILLANAYHGAWTSGATPPDAIPDIRTVLIQPHQPAPSPDQHV